MAENLMERYLELSPAAERAWPARRPSLADELADLTSYVRDEVTDAAATWDLYGEKGLVAELERRLTELFEVEAAAFFPSGIMAQQAALRTWCDRAGTRRIALPDLSHLLGHEEDGPRRLHGFEIEHLTTGPVTPTAAHVAAIPGRLGAVLVELPLRDGGYLLPAWEELVGVADACRARGVPLHLDGARLWESAPFYDRPLAEIAGLANSTYVSFYKGLGGLHGAALLGAAEFVAEARLWRRRHGGTVFTTGVEAAAALRGLDRALPRMAECHAYAVDLAAALAEKGLRTTPHVPHTTAFRLHVAGTPEELLGRATQLAEGGLALPARWQPTATPGWSFTEITVTPASIDAWPDAAAAAEAIAGLAS